MLRPNDLRLTKRNGVLERHRPTHYLLGIGRSRTPATKPPIPLHGRMGQMRRTLRLRNEKNKISPSRLQHRDRRQNAIRHVTGNHIHEWWELLRWFQRIIYVHVP